MKPSPLPSNPTLLDRLEYALQWSLCPFIIEPRGHPVLAGLATAVLMTIPVAGIVLLIEGLLWLLHVFV
jgi:hypothetical protein